MCVSTLRKIFVSTLREMANFRLERNSERFSFAVVRNRVALPRKRSNPLLNVVPLPNV